MTWQPEQGLEPVDENGNWLKWTDGQTISFVVLQDQPNLRVIHWVDGKSVDCTAPGCSICQQGIKRKRRYVLVVLTDDGKACWEMSSRTWRNLIAIASTFGQLRGLRLSVMRQGTGLETNYVIITQGTVPDDQLPTEEDSAKYLVNVLTKKDDDTDQDKPSLTLEAVERDPKNASDYVKELAEALNTTAQKEIAYLVSTRGDEYQKLPAAAQLYELIAHLERKLDVRKSEPAKTINLDQLLGS